ncbi:hypothetical protein AOQ84DRAFT_226579 [Glonium stellatum]|uniref:Uncharacterized protein n=1 Tax=Glonium stellatum TaxID=574774 RepID=A0A8E2ESV6_9PEZI|nr:hypothetical protein AOQ84DRAFT_226579 [Glonium stellatum]
MSSNIPSNPFHQHRATDDSTMQSSIPSSCSLPDYEAMESTPGHPFGQTNSFTLTPPRYNACTGQYDLYIASPIAQARPLSPEKQAGITASTVGQIPINMIDPALRSPARSSQLYNHEEGYGMTIMNEARTKRYANPICQSQKELFMPVLPTYRIDKAHVDAHPSNHYHSFSRENNGHDSDRNILPAQNSGRGKPDKLWAAIPNTPGHPSSHSKPLDKHHLEARLSTLYSPCPPATPLNLLLQPFNPVQEEAKRSSYSISRDENLNANFVSAQENTLEIYASAESNSYENQAFDGDTIGADTTRSGGVAPTKSLPPPFKSSHKMEFSSFAEAKAYRRRPLWRPVVPDNTMPITDTETQTWAKRVFDALLNITGCLDHGSTAYNHWLHALYPSKDIECMAFEIVYEAYQLHQRGSNLWVFNFRRLSAKDALAGEDAADEASRSIYADQELNFRERMEAIITHLQHWKSTCDFVMTGEKISWLVNAPIKYNAKCSMNQKGNHARAQRSRLLKAQSEGKHNDKMETRNGSPLSNSLHSSQKQATHLGKQECDDTLKHSNKRERHSSDDCGLPNLPLDQQQPLRQTVVASYLHPDPATPQLRKTTAEQQKTHVIGRRSSTRAGISTPSHLARARNTTLSSSPQALRKQKMRAAKAKAISYAPPK